MPLVTPRIIQVSFTYEAVTVFAGNDQNIICDVIVTLQGSINGTVDRHTYQWVQTSGTVVTLNNANTLTAWFLNPNTDDLSFRLYVDRYTPNETFDDITVYRNPVSITALGRLDTSNADYSSLNDFDVQAGLQLQTAKVVPKYYADSNATEIIGGFPTTECMIVWTIPSNVVDRSEHPFHQQSWNSYEFQGVYVQRYESGSWITSAFIPKTTEYYILPNNAGTAYRVQAVWKQRMLISTVKKTFDDTIIVITPGDWGILRSYATSPAPTNFHGNDGAVFAALAVSSQHSFQLVISNPMRISNLGLDAGIIGDGGHAATDYNSSILRVQGELFQEDDVGVLGLGDVGTPAISLTITRTSGISIG